jgi:transcriptional regulator with XRE-family HTH domain
MKKNILEFNKDLFGKRVKTLRQKYNMTQEAVADYLNLTRAAYGGCENGNFRPSVDILLGVRQLFMEKGEKSISMDWLFGFSETQEGFVRRIDQSSELSRLNEKIQSLEELLSSKNEIIELYKKKK